MGVIAVVKTETGERIRGIPDPSGGTCDAAGDFDRIGETVGASTMLKYIDPYGDTMFNRIQVVDLLAELDQLDLRQFKSVERRGLGRLRALAERCRDEAHLYLWFIGD